MKFAYDMSQAGSFKRPIPLYGAGTNINAGAAIIRGSTAGTNQGYGVVGTGACSAFMGVTETAFPAATKDNDPGAGTKYLLTDVLISPKAVWACDYDTTFGSHGLTIASVASGNPTITSLENISGGWLLGDDGELHFVESVSSGAATLKEASSWTTSNKVIKILPLYDPNISITTTADLIAGSTAAAGSTDARVLENYMKSKGYDQVSLDPTKHSGLTLPDFATFEFYAMIIFPVNIYNSTN